MIKDISEHNYRRVVISPLRIHQLFERFFPNTLLSRQRRLHRSSDSISHQPPPLPRLKYLTPDYAHLFLVSTLFSLVIHIPSLRPDWHTIRTDEN